MVYLIYAYIFVLGLFMGSFFNVVGIRIPNHETLMGRSHCPVCDHKLGVLELIPIVGYLWLRGKCKHCATPISLKYPLVELITGILFLVSYMILKENMIEYIVIVIFISLMTIVTVSDLYYKIVPDIILLIFLVPLLLLRMFGDTMIWYESLLGGASAFLFLLAIAYYGRKRFKQEALGGGDIKLYFLIGLVLGYDLVLFSLMVAALLGIVYGLFVRQEKRSYLPFVPFIFAGSMIAYFVGDIVIESYLQLIYSLIT